MKQFVWTMILGLVLSLFAPLTAQAASLNNFTITNYDIEFHLSKDDQGHSTLRTVETITANFPPNQNRGIERAIPRNYDGHTTDVKVLSVTDQAGQDRQYTTRSTGGNTIVRVGDPDRYVSGLETYVLTYARQDVTKNFSDRDEFYWDTNGTDWRVPIQQLSVSLTLDESVRQAFSGQAACYQGSQGSQQTCQLVKGDGEFSVRASNLAAGENVTIAIGFDKDTFAKYQTPLWLMVFIGWVFLQVLLGMVALGLIIYLGVAYHRRSKRTAEHDPIAPEYLPPRDSSVEVSARLLGRAQATFSAQIIDLAVRHYLKIREIKPKKGWSPGEYELEIVKSIDDLRAEEQEFMRDLFSSQTAIGTKLNLKELQKDTKAYTRFQDNHQKTKALVRGQYALRHKAPTQTAWFRRFSAVMLIFGILLLSPPLLIVSLVAFIMSFTIWPLTDKGLGLLRYLKGLKMYIQVAEAERLRMLQSPEGAEKVGDVSHPAKLVKLYERVLPYAVLFGIEKEWNKQLGAYYETTNTQPDWFSGYGGAAFSGAAFSSAMSSFATTSSYSSHSSSSSSGSSGGGFSGGGGGGGGGGGW